jgi:hypothetical protein
MAQLTAASANLRVFNEDKRSVFSVANVSPTVNANTVAGFVDAVETLYNDGSCDARIIVVMKLER